MDKVIAFLQARITSSRLPGKVLKTILGEPMLYRQIERVRRCENIDRLVVVTSTDPSDDMIEEMCQSKFIECFRGSLDDVLNRFIQASRAYPAEHIVRLTGDCPLADHQLIDAMISFYMRNDFDMVTNVLKPTYPDGLDTWIFKREVLEESWRSAALPSYREHVTLYIMENTNKFRVGSYEALTDSSSFRWTVDEPEDFEFVESVYKEMYPKNNDFSSEDIFGLLKARPELLELNGAIERDEGLADSRKKDQEWSGVQ